jgi:hypothetical protein
LITRDTVDVETPASLATVLIDIGGDYINILRDFHELPPYIVARDRIRTTNPIFSMNAKLHFIAAILLCLIQITHGAAAAQPAQPAPTLDVRALGATADGKTKDTAAFQKALDACADTGGAVIVPAGKYLIGSIQLRSGATLILQKNAVVTGSPDATDYPLVPVRFEGAMVQGHRALVWAQDAHDVSIIGPGTLAGDNKIGNLRNPRGPVMVELVNCENVNLDGFTDRYRRLWSVHLLFCRNVVARHLTIRTTYSNGDGIDVDSSAHVLIENCDIDTGDDCISLKSGRGISAVRLARPTEDVVIANCALASDFAGVGIGSEMSGGIRNVRIENCNFTAGVNAVYIKGRIGRGGFFENITGKNLNVATRIFLGLNLRDAGIIGVDPVSGEEGVPRARNIAFSNVKVNGGTLVDGARVPPGKFIDGLSLSNVTGTCRRAITLANAVNVNLSNIDVTGYTGALLTTRNVTGTGLDGAVALRVPLLEDADQLQIAFSQPPDDTRPMVRWWWFGPAVTKPQLQHQMEMMKQGGFGGFEVQPTYPLTLDEKIPGAANLKFLSPEFLDAVNFVAAKAKEMGLRMDLTLGSGWPYGGSMISIDDAAGRLRFQRVRVGAAQSSVEPQQLRDGDAVIAAFAGDSLQAIPLKNGVAQLPATQPSPTEVTFFVSSHTGMKVKRPAFGAEGYVIDHQTAAAVQKFLASIAEPEVAACGSNPPYAVFCDSLESGAEDWTGHFLDEFQKRRGYDLRPLLPALVSDVGSKTLEIRHDWGKTLTELFNDNFVKQLRSFAEKHGTRFRIQAYGMPSAALYSYASCNLPEGEGYQWHDYRATRYATSACHLLGVPVCSSETFTWIHSPVFRATPLDVKAEADLHFLQGVNQIICHGWPYTPAGVAFPGWSFYAAGVFDDQNPWYIVMPDVTRYLQRVSFMLRQGSPANDVALYLPNDDAWAKFTPGKVALTDLVGECIGHQIVGEILDSGYNLDFFDDGMLDARGRADNGSLLFGQGGRGESTRGQSTRGEGGGPGGIRYHVVVLAGVERMPLSTLKKLDDFAARGGVLIATRRLPGLVPGYTATDADQKALQTIVRHLFQDPDAPGIFIADESRFAETVESLKKFRPDVQFSPAAPQIGFVRRNTDGGAVYFLANTSNQPKRVTAGFRTESIFAQQLDPVTGKITPMEIVGHPEGYTSVQLALAPYGSTILLFSNRLYSSPAATRPAPPAVDLNSGWSVAFGPDAKPAPLSALRSWTDDVATRSFSGVASYANHFTLSADLLAAGRIAMDFGDGAPSKVAEKRLQGYHAELDAPVRDAAVVYINGKRAGAVWCAPYRLDVTELLKAGDNDVRIDVANTAVNYLAAHGFPNYDYQGVSGQYGSRFSPAAAAQFQPIPSGLLGSIKLIGGGSI